LFKYFDLDGYGTICFKEFKKAFEALGCVFKDCELEALFKKYDSNQNGKLDYEEFSAFFARKGSGNNPNVNPVFGMKREPPTSIIDKIKKTLKERGSSGIRGAGVVFRRMDDSGNKKLDREEFMWGLREMGHKLTPSEFEKIFKYFDKDNSGQINFDEFLVALRGEMNERRKKLVMMAFNKLDHSKTGVVTIDDIKHKYDASEHPEVKAGKKSKTEVL